MTDQLFINEPLSYLSGRATVSDGSLWSGHATALSGALGAGLRTRAVKILLYHTKIESTVRYLGVDVEDALHLAPD